MIDPRLGLLLTLLVVAPAAAEQVEFLPTDVDVLAAVWHPDGRCVEAGLTRRREGRGVTLDVPPGAAWGGFPLVRLTPQVVAELRRAGATAVGLIDPKPEQLALLQAFPELEVLHLRNTRRLRDGDLHALTDLGRLRQLQLDQARHLTREGLAPLKRLERLTYLGLTEATALSGAPLAALGDGVRAVDLSLCRGVTSLEGASESLERLRLDGCLGLGPKGLLALGRLPDLRALSLRGCLLDGAVLEALPGGLRELDLGLTYAGSADVVALLARQPALKVLRLPGCERLTGQVAPALAACEGLRELDLREADWVDAAALALLAGLPRLAQLDLSGAAVLGADLAKLAPAAALTELRLAGCTRLGPASGQALAQLKHLRRLDLAHTPLTDAALAPLGGLPALRELDLSGCAGLTDAGIAHLAGLPLERLELSGCRRLGPGSVEALAQLQTLRELDLVGAGLGGESLTRLRDALPACAIRSLE